MKFIKILLYSYECEESYNNLNYNIISNLIDFKNILLNKQYEKIIENGNKYISFIKNFTDNNYKSTCFKNNFKTITNHKSNIHHLSKLSDGRLISCDNNGLLNIYKKDSYELQLSININKVWLSSFTELKDGRIIIYSGDKTMKIIKLIEDNKYNIKETLIGLLLLLIK